MRWPGFSFMIYAYSVHLRNGEYHLIFTPEYYKDGLDLLKAKLPEQYRTMRGLGYLDSELYDNFTVTENKDAR